jgi:PPOX class probable FMN-dependent enzyme
MRDPHRIETVEQLREMISEPPQFMHDIKGTRILEEERAFIERSPLLLLATCDADGRMDVSPKGDAPGFAIVEDETTIVIPDRPGNHLAYGHLNLLSNPRVGVIFLVPGTPETVRLNGSAELTRDPELLARLAARNRNAELATRIHVEECFFHCAKAFLRSELWKPETWEDRLKVSFGEMFAKRQANDPLNSDVVTAVDASVEKDYIENL